MLTISLVSHGHGQMVWRLADQLVACTQVTRLIITLNIPEAVPECLNKKITLIKNFSAKGFGQNHNFAFNLSEDRFFGVLNPDIELLQNPFCKLLLNLEDKNCGVVAPLIVNKYDKQEDSIRKFITPWSLLKRLTNPHSVECQVSLTHGNFYPDWVAGMFMIFKSDIYSNLNGFDEDYFMYCEDADICERLRKAGYDIMVCPEAKVIHNAQRASRKKLNHFCWHVNSMFRYFRKHLFRRSLVAFSKRFF